MVFIIKYISTYFSCRLCFIKTNFGIFPTASTILFQSEYFIFQAGLTKTGTEEGILGVEKVGERGVFPRGGETQRILCSNNNEIQYNNQLLKNRE